MKSKEGDLASLVATFCWTSPMPRTGWAGFSDYYQWLGGHLPPSVYRRIQAGRKSTGIPHDLKAKPRASCVFVGPFCCPRRVGPFHDAFTKKRFVLQMRDSKPGLFANGFMAAMGTTWGFHLGGWDNNQKTDPGWFQTWLLFSIIYINIWICVGYHPSHWRTPSFFKMVETTNQDGSVGGSFQELTS